MGCSRLLIHLSLSHGLRNKKEAPIAIIGERGVGTMTLENKWYGRLVGQGQLQ